MKKLVGVLTTTSPVVHQRFQEEKEAIIYAQEVLESFIDGLNARASEDDIEFVPIQYMNLEFRVTGEEASVVDSKSGKDLKEFDFIYVKSWKRFNDAASTVAVYLDRNNVKYDPAEISKFRSISKITEAYIMWSRGLRIPDTFYSPANHRLKHILSEHDFGGKGIVVKDEDGFGGNTNFLIKDVDELDKILKDHPLIDFVAQTFIPNDRDYRLLMMGGEMKLIIERTREENGTHLNNTTQGAKARLIDINDFDQKVLHDSEELARSMSRTTSGVDVMINSETGEPFFLEINKSPQLGSGAFLDEKLDAFYDYVKGNV